MARPVVLTLSESEATLRLPSIEVSCVEAHKTAALLLVTLKFVADGVGLAAPQLGIQQQVAVVTVDLWRLILVNPVVRPLGGSHGEEAEGCLSLPGRAFKVRRWNSISVKTFAHEGEPTVIQATGWLARVIQHEVDHLKGALVDQAGEEVT